MASQLISNANSRADSLLDSAEVFVKTLEEGTASNTIQIDYNARYSPGFGGAVGSGGGYWNLAPWDGGLDDNTKPDDVPGYEDREYEVSAALTTLINARDETGAIASPQIPDLPEVSNKTVSFYDEAEDDIKVWAEGLEAELPEFLGEAPTIIEPTLPTTAVPDAPADHTVDDVTIDTWTTKTPPVNDVEMFEPVISFAEAQQIDVIDMTVPEMNLIAPVNEFAHEETTYSSGLLTSLQNLITSDIDNGGYGINPDDEQNIYNRARTREAEQAAISVNQARKGIAARGFPMPPGSLYAIERVILSKADASLSELNKEIVINRSDLYLKARQFAVQQGLNLEQALITYTSGKQERALKVAQLTADFAIQYHNTQVQLTQLDIEIKQLEQTNHRVQLDVAAMRLQEYGQKLAYADLTIKTNQNRLEKYNQQLEEVKVFNAAQTARDEHTKLSIEIQRLKLQGHQQEVASFGIEVKARTDEFAAYKLEWDGEEIKQRAFVQQLTAHDQKVKTVIDKSKIKKDRFDAEITLLNSAKEKQALLLDHYSAILNRSTLEEGIRSTMHKEEFDMWQAKKEDKDRYDRFAYERNVEKANKLLESTQTNIKQLDVAMKAFLGAQALKSQSAEAALRLYAGSASAAEGAFVAIGSIADASV
jgi:hypothetical protein